MATIAGGNSKSVKWPLPRRMKRQGKSIWPWPKGIDNWQRATTQRASNLEHTRRSFGLRRGVIQTKPIYGFHPLRSQAGRKAPLRRNAEQHLPLAVLASWRGNQPNSDVRPNTVVGSPFGWTSGPRWRFWPWPTSARWRLTGKSKYTRECPINDPYEAAAVWKAEEAEKPAQ